MKVQFEITDPTVDVPPMGNDDHMAVWEAENAVSPDETRWLTWIARVESLMGHDADGDQAEDGYSMDWFYDLFKSGWSAEQASAARYFPL